MKVPKYPVKLRIAVSYTMKEELQKIAEERNMSVAELVRYWLEANIKYWRET